VQKDLVFRAVRRNGEVLILSLVLDHKPRIGFWQQLEAGLRAPDASQMLSYGALKLLPFWDPLRGDPRFEKIVASLAPKENRQ